MHDEDLTLRIHRPALHLPRHSTLQSYSHLNSSSLKFLRLQNLVLGRQTNALFPITMWSHLWVGHPRQRNTKRKKGRYKGTHFNTVTTTGSQHCKKLQSRFSTLTHNHLFTFKKEQTYHFILR